MKLQHRLCAKQRGAEQLHELLTIAARLHFVEERSELLGIEFYPC